MGGMCVSLFSVMVYNADAAFESLLNPQFKSMSYTLKVRIVSVRRARQDRSLFDV